MLNFNGKCSLYFNKIFHLNLMAQSFIFLLMTKPIVSVLIDYFEHEYISCLYILSMIHFNTQASTDHYELMH